MMLSNSNFIRFDKVRRSYLPEKLTAGFLMALPVFSPVSSIDETGEKTGKAIRKPAVSFSGKYERRTLSNLIKLELLNIIRDNYFWIIIGCGSLFLSFVFWLGSNNNGVPDFPRTVTLLGIFNDAFPFFVLD